MWTDECPVELGKDRAWYERTWVVDGDLYQTMWSVHQGGVFVAHYRNTTRHRLDGPAWRRLSSGQCEWYVNGQHVDCQSVDDPAFKRAVLKYLQEQTR